MRCLYQCYEVGGPWIAENPACPVHGTDAQAKTNKVYLGYECYYNGCDVWRTVVRVFDDEVKALVWKEEFVSEDPNEWREYKEMEIE